MKKLTLTALFSLISFPPLFAGAHYYVTIYNYSDRAFYITEQGSASGHYCWYPNDLSNYSTVLPYSQITVHTESNNNIFGCRNATAWQYFRIFATDISTLANEFALWRENKNTTWLQFANYPYSSTPKLNYSSDNRYCGAVFIKQNGSTYYNEIAMNYC